MANDFWTSANVEPKRKFRFLVEFPGDSGAMGVLWFAKGVTKPEISVNPTEHQFLNHKFYFPGNVEWSEVTVTLVDPVSPDAAQETANILVNSGYPGPMKLNPSTNANPETISKLKSTSALGQVVIRQIDSSGNNLEVWTLRNAFITKVTYGELSYGDEELTEITIALRYDWATLTGAEGKESWSAS
jgi:hypothetical protein